MGEWQKELVTQIGIKVAESRGDRSLQWLEQRTEALGFKVGRGAISRLENGKRESISVAEWLVLAAALDVPPALLLFPKYPYGGAEYLPGQFDACIRAHEWLSGEAQLSDRRVESRLRELAGLEQLPEGIFIVFPGNALILAGRKLDIFEREKFDEFKKESFEDFQEIIDWIQSQSRPLEDDVRKAGGYLGREDDTR